MKASGEARQLIEALGERNQAERPGEQAFAPEPAESPSGCLVFPQPRSSPNQLSVLRRQHRPKSGVSLDGPVRGFLRSAAPVRASC